MLQMVKEINFDLGGAWAGILVSSSWLRYLIAE